MTEHYNDDVLIRYLDDELTGEEKLQLEKDLDSNPQLKEQLLQLQLAVEAVKQAGNVQKIKSIHREMMQEMSASNVAAPVRKMVRSKLAIAASIILVALAIGTWWWLQPSASGLYQQAFVDYQVSTTRTANANESEIRKNYASGDYNAVIKADRSSLSSEDSLLVGISHLKMEQIPSAISWNSAVAHSASKFRQDAEFYLALCYLKIKQYDSTLVIVQSIRNNPAHLFRERFTPGFISKLESLRDKQR
jgi:hypothetical protein